MNDNSVENDVLSDRKHFLITKGNFNYFLMACVLFIVNIGVALSIPTSPEPLNPIFLSFALCLLTFRLMLFFMKECFLKKVVQFVTFLSFIGFMATLGLKHWDYLF